MVPAPTPAVVVAAPPTEPGIARPPPAGLASKELASWHVARVREHERLRALSFYDTGVHIARLLELRAVVGARDIKELCSKVDLGMSHMTANKYLQVARTFDRATALREGIEKCYALTLYAKAVGRAGQGAEILARDEPVRGTRALRAKGASASKLYEAVRALKEAAKKGREPDDVRAANALTADSAEKFVRKLGFKKAEAEIVRRHGETRVAIYISLEVAKTLESHVPAAFARMGRSLAKTRPELFAPLRAAGWRLTGAG
jgi:hypothetical protein